jgi:hypothetical protein
MVVQINLTLGDVVPFAASRVGKNPKLCLKGQTRRPIWAIGPK